jgi:hypothetical protein
LNEWASELAAWQHLGIIIFPDREVTERKLVFSDGS